MVPLKAFLHTSIILLFLCPAVPAFSRQAVLEGKGLDTEPVYWYEKDTKKKAWRAIDELAIFTSGSRDIAGQVVPDSEVLDHKGRLIIIRVKDPLGVTRETIEKALTSSEVSRASPVYYEGRHKDPSRRLVPTGNIIVRFAGTVSEKQLASFEKRYNLIMTKKVKFAADTYVFRIADTMLTVETAKAIQENEDVNYACPDWIKPVEKESNDFHFPDQWHLENTGQGTGTPGEDVNITDVWNTYRGTLNEVIAIVDDGLEITHEDLAYNCMSGIHWDFVDNDDDPSPVGTPDDHGTAVGGVAAAVGFNSLGVCGAAPSAGLAGFRLLGDASTYNVASAFSRGNDIIDIYNNSWSYPALTDIGPLVLDALVYGVENGRQGKGNIYVKSGGNNGKFNEDSNLSPLAALRYTIAVAASTNDGKRAHYSEEGANIVINAPSSGGSLAITTTDRTAAAGYSAGNYCSSFGGTSSAAPLVSGIIALMLEANPDLGWRDVQHVLMETAQKNDPDDADWTTNTAGYHISHKYGFGRIDALAAVTEAENRSPAEPGISTQGSSSPGIPIPDNDPAGVSDVITIDEDLTIEFVEIYLTAPHTYSGDLDVILVSPGGTESILARQTIDVYKPDGYANWCFGSVRHYGESSAGDWTLHVIDDLVAYMGIFESWSLNIHGQSPQSPPSDTQAPVITGVTTTPVSETSTEINWNTNEESDSTLRYGTNSSPWESYTFEETDPSMVSSHSITLTGLTPATTYYFRVGSSDAAGNGPGQNPDATNPSPESTFETLPCDPDLTPHSVLFNNSQVEGGRYSMEVTCRNIGEGPGSATHMELYFSTDNSFDAKDYRAGKKEVPSIQSRESHTVKYEYTMPDLASGTYPVWMIVRVDCDNEADESDENNNTMIFQDTFNAVDRDDDTISAEELLIVPESNSSDDTCFISAVIE